MTLLIISQALLHQIMPIFQHKLKKILRISSATDDDDNRLPIVIFQLFLLLYFESSTSSSSSSSFKPMTTCNIIINNNHNHDNNCHRLPSSILSHRPKFQIITIMMLPPICDKYPPASLLSMTAVRDNNEDGGGDTMRWKKCLT